MAAIWFRWDFGGRIGGWGLYDDVILPGKTGSFSTTGYVTRATTWTRLFKTSSCGYDMQTAVERGAGDLPSRSSVSATGQDEALRQSMERFLLVQLE